MSFGEIQRAVTKSRITFSLSHFLLARAQRGCFLRYVHDGHSVVSDGANGFSSTPTRVPAHQSCAHTNF